MNPQGLLIASDSKVESLRLQGRDFDIEALALVLADADFQRVAEQYVRVDFSMLDGQLSMVGISDDGSRYSLHRRSYRPVAVADDLLNRLAEQLQPEFAIASRQLLLAADNYYYAQHQSVEFPVYRVIIDDPQGSRYYLSPVSGQIKLKVDSSTRWYRWLFYAVHRMDFIPLARFSSVREYFMIVLLVGVVMLCGTGTWLAVRRLLR